MLPLLLIPAALLALADKGALRRLKRRHALLEFNRKYNEKMEACLRAHKAILIEGIDSCRQSHSK